MAQRTCMVDGCEKKHRAKGLCGSHYNAANYTAEQRHPKVKVPCTACGKLVAKHPGKRYRPFCDYACRDAYMVENNDGPWGQTNRGIRKTAPIYCDQPSWPKWDGKWSPLQLSVCDICGSRFMHQAGQQRRYCTKRCSNRAHDLRKRGRHKIRRLAIFERDGYVCWMCEKVCPSAAVVPHPDAPTVDHLTPRSLGGTDDEDNLATACFACNTKRGASWTIPSAA